MVRSIGLDVRRDFCDVAVPYGGRARSAGWVASTTADLALFAASLAIDDSRRLASRPRSAAAATATTMPCPRA